MPEMKLSGKTVLMVIPFTQFRDEEFFDARKALESEGAKVVVASTAIRTCHGMDGGTVQSEITTTDAKAEDYNALVLCGGSSVPDFLWTDKKLIELATAMGAAGKVVAAISLSPVVLAKAKLLTDIEATVYFLPQAIQELKTGGAKYVKGPLVVAKNIITAEGPEQTMPFAQAISKALLN